MFLKKKKLYIIGDVHGCYKTLLALINQLPEKEKSHLVFVGDLIDRGRYSSLVIEFIKNGEYDCVKGNHEQMMIDSHKPSEEMYSSSLSRSIAVWNANGGKATEKSYVSPFADLLHPHLKWIKQLPNYLVFDIEDENGKSLFVTHGFGLQFWQEKNNPDFVTKLRETRPTHNEIIDKKIPVFNVFGHHPVDKIVITDSYAAIDTGCVFGDYLTALEWPTKRTFQQKFID